MATRVPDCHPDKKHASHGLCKQCYDKKYSKDNHDKLLAQSREWRRAHPEESRQYGRKWKANNQEKVKESRQNYHAKNSSLLLEKHREYNSKNKIGILEKFRQYRASNPQKRAAVKRKYNVNNVEKVSQSGRRRKLKYNYGITVDEYDAMFKQQGGVCSICEGTNGGKSLCVDHDHKTGKVRGLLCTACNAGIGRLKDDANIVEKALSYLKRYVVKSYD